MIKKEQLDLIFQIMSSMEDGTIKLEEAYNRKNAGEFEYAKKEILEFQKRLSLELKKEEKEI